MKKKKSLLEKLYVYDGKRNAYMIDIALAKYEEIYNEWDPTPFKKRDIEEEFIDYVIDSSLDIPFRYNIELNLYLPENKKDEKKEKNVKMAIKSYFTYLLAKSKKSIISSLVRICKSLVIGFILLSVSYNAFALNSVVQIESIFIEGINILGWVAMWNVGEEFLFVGIEKFNQRRVLKRLSESKVNFIYK